MVYFFHIFFNAFFLRIDHASSMKKPLSQGGTSRRRERKKKEYQRRERLRRKKIKVREKVGKSRNTVFFQGLVAPEGRKVDSLKWRVRSHLVVWEIKTCAPLWREARFEVKMKKAPRARSISVRSWKLRCWKIARRCGAKHISMCQPHNMFGPLLEVDVEKVHAVVARSSFRIEHVKSI